MSNNNIFTNNASTTLATAINTAVTSLSVATATGGLFPLPGSFTQFYTSLVDSASNVEIVLVTARVGDVFTIVRAQEGTTAKAFPIGSTVELRITAANATNWESKGPAGTGNDQTGYENDQLITGAFTVGQSAMISGAVISIATPAVVTIANTFVAGQPVRLTTTGALPTGLVVNSQYFVSSAGLTTAGFQVAATQTAAVAGTGSIATTGTQSGVHSVGKCKDIVIVGGLRVATGASFTVPSGSKAVFL